MALLDNQIYKKKVSFVSSDNEDNSVVINLSVACNREIPKHTLTSIEAYISGLFLSNYMTLEAHKKNEKLKKKQQKLQQQNEKLKEKNEKQKQKLEAKKETVDEKPVVEKKSKKKAVEEREYIIPVF
jgi:outer membrane biosynthesis protein TonB